MILQSHLVLFLLLLIFYVSGVLGTQPTSFCKCTCFSNSTIIQLGPPSPGSNGLSIVDARDLNDADIFLGARDADADGDGNGGDSKQHQKDGDDRSYRSLNCNDCNRKLCLEHQLPKCKGATQEDIVTTCFQRDSKKDQAVVFIFIIATSSLLVWAAIKPWAERWIQAARERRSYHPLSAQEEDDR
ncbi:hypothetical protein VTO42DRAFT_8848 [Malbranchea cinnamomea]